QSEKLLHVSNIFANEIGPKVAAMLNHLILLGSSGHVNGRVFFANSGTEVNEAAIKLARKFGLEEGRHHIITATGSFHGRTMGSLSATGQRSKQASFEPLLPGFTHVEWNNIAAMESAISGQTVAVMLEPIQGEAGVIDPTPGYLEAARELCNERGLLLIMDEVQTGLGRTGAWFAFQHHSILPDIVTIAKSLGSGVPIGACWARDDVAAAFSAGDHGATFGGQPLAASAALATIREMIEIDAPNRASELGDRIDKNFEGNKEIRYISGSGLLRGVNLVRPAAKKIAEIAQQKGLIINPIGDDTIRLAPPLVVSSSQIDRACDLITEAIGESQ
ncbi:MAG: aminotransferase class III-fold pyridoxal phosphate-dependent enzyme, partial [Acidimicrobiaceae bacterium]|nr:aminotransferase class III-fold pyridoxal phosphate-dependent enzyme [Acidimicrobiaceae bacterium]